MTRNNAQAIRELRVRAVLAGLCQICRCRPQKVGRKTCQQCLSEGYQRKRRLITERRASGLCICGRDPKPDQSWCERCLGRTRQNNKGRISRAVAAGCCRRCLHAPVVPDRRFCLTCRDRINEEHRARADRNRARSRCRCGRRSRREYTTCSRCGERNRLGEQKRRDLARSMEHA